MDGWMEGGYVFIGVIGAYANGGTGSTLWSWPSLMKTPGHALAASVCRVKVVRSLTTVWLGGRECMVVRVCSI